MIEKRKNMWFVLTGIVIIFISLGADILGIGGDLRLGLKQIFGIIFGFLMVGIGFDYYFSSKSENFSRKKTWLIMSWLFLSSGGILLSFYFCFNSLLGSIRISKLLPILGFLLIVLGMWFRFPSFFQSFLKFSKVGINAISNQLLKFIKSITDHWDNVFLIMGMIPLAFLCFNYFVNNSSQYNLIKNIVFTQISVLFLLTGWSFKHKRIKLFTHSKKSFDLFLSLLILVLVFTGLDVLFTNKNFFNIDSFIKIPVEIIPVVLGGIFLLFLILIIKKIKIFIFEKIGILNFSIWFTLLFLFITGISISDLFRGSLLVIVVFCLIGLLPAIFIFLPERKPANILAISPVLGFCFVHLIGAVLTRLDITVSNWTWIFTFLWVIISLGIIFYFHIKTPCQFNKLDWHDFQFVLGGFLSVILLSLTPIIIGGLKFSVFRGNVDDANNYLGMASVFNNVPLSLVKENNLPWLFQQNPIYPWAAKIISGERWSMPMAMAFGSNIAGIPLYRFDLAYSAICLTFLFGVIFLIARKGKLSPIMSLLLGLASSVGFYSQLIMDIRAESEVASMPVLFLVLWLLIHLCQSFFDNPKEQYFSRHSFFYIISCASLAIIYPEIFTVFGLGISFLMLFVLFRKWLSFKSILIIFLFTVSGMLLAFLITPNIVNFFIKQISSAALTDPPWENAFFQWLLKGNCTGIMGFSPYQMDIFSRILAEIFSWCILALTILSIGKQLFFTKKPNFSSLICLFIMIAGIILYIYFSFQEKYWQAGKAFTYSSLLIPVTIAFSSIFLDQLEWNWPKKRDSKFFAVINQMIRLTLILQILIGVNRIGMAWNGYEYPLYISSGNNPQTYQSKYDWDLEPIRKIISQKDRSVVWISGNVYVNEFLSVALNHSAQLNSVSMISGWTPLYNSETINNWPDYLLIEKKLLPIQKDNSFFQNALYIDKNKDGLALIKIPDDLTQSPWLVGMEGASGNQLITYRENNEPGFTELGQNIPIGLQILSGKPGDIFVDIEIDVNDLVSLDQDIIKCSVPSGGICSITNNGNKFRAKFTAKKGYNYLLINPEKKINLWLQDVSF